MLRARLPHVLMLVLSLAACGKKEQPPVPAPEPPSAAKAESSTKVEPTAATPTPTAAATAAPTAEALAAIPTDAPAPAPVVKAAAATTGSGEIVLPKPKNGVLAKGAADKIIALGAAPIVRLIDAGADPKSDLSYALTKGAAQKTKMAMDVAMAMKMGSKSMPAANIPQMTMLMDIATVDKSPAGEWKIDSKLSQINVSSKGGQEDQIAAAMKPQLEAMKGLGMVYWINGKGHVRDFKIDVPKGFPPGADQMLQGMNQSFESMVAPLPDAPVGVGAKWQVVSRVANAGADLIQSAIYTLKTRTGSKVTLEVALTQLSASETITPPGMPAGMTAHVKSFSSGGSGTSQIDTGALAPEAGSLQLKTNMSISLEGGAPGGDETSVETTTKVAISKP